MTTNTQRAEALLHLVLRISAIRTDRDVTTDLMCSDLGITRISAIRYTNFTNAKEWIVSITAAPDDGVDNLRIDVGGSGDTYRAAMDDALADYADKLLNAIKIRDDWAEEEGEAL